MDSIVLSKKEFNDLKNLVYSISGINLHEGKIELLKSKIAKRMRVTKKSLKDYLRLLNSNEKEVIEFIDTVTTNHSFFFRENKSIEYIINQFNLHPQKKRKEFKIWCAACSTGDEPYSIAVQLKNMGLSFSILATDISHSVLDIAARGIYKKDKIQKVPLPILHRYFQNGTGKYTGHIKIKKEISRHIVFEKFNLITDPAPQANFDAVLCRNVMIYFDLKTSEKVVNKLYRAIVPRGFFAIGNAESLMSLNHHYKPVKKIPSLYMK
jgi:chemotaxis protein methyltransferase CheR